MTEQNAFGPATNWRDEDFTDPATADFDYDDPWSIPQEIAEFAAADVPAADISADDALPPDFDDDDDDSDLAVSDFDEFVYDDPEPFAEYDGDLGVPLYDEDAIDIDHLSLRCDEFISGVRDLTEPQRTQISELLGDLGSSRLRRWLPWMIRQDWTGQTLLLFLEFRINHWEENPQWWEVSFRHSHLGQWWAFSNHNTLSLGATYRLIQARAHLPPDKVVNEAWIKDWEDLPAWNIGFPSFAAFAVFRAELGDSEDWRSRAVDFGHELLPEQEENPNISSRLYEAFDRGRSEALMASMDRDYRVWDDIPSYPHPNAASRWFAIQDWYEPSEWHDGLEWGCNGIESEHPYLSDESLDNMSKM